METDPLLFVPVDKWDKVQKIFLTDWPRSISACMLLDRQKQLLKYNLNYGIKVYCPFGDATNGMVVINEKIHTAYEVIIQCPKDDTSVLEEAICESKVIDWTRSVVVPYAPEHIIELCDRLADRLDKIVKGTSGAGYMLDKDHPLFENESLPSGVTLGLLRKEHAELVNEKWPHKFRDSIQYIELLIQTESGYALYKDGELISWVFINENGPIGHLYTLEDHRRKGYAELLLRLMSNIMLKKGRPIHAYCVEGNDSAKVLYERNGFKCFGDIAWRFLKDKTKETNNST